jgi:hypothetical protein
VPKRDAEVGQWTAFWKTLGIVEPKRQRFLRNYKPAVQDIAPLVRLGLERATIEKVQRQLSSYRDPLLFNKFCRFFRRDPQTVQYWSGAANPTDAFRRLYRVFARNDLPTLRKRLGELWLLSERNRKGEGRRFEIKYRRIGSVAKISGQRFTRRLNLYDARAKYHFENAFNYAGTRIISIKKRAQGGDVRKFVTLERLAQTVEAKIAADSKSEYWQIRMALRDFFESYVDSPQGDADLGALRRFTQTGESQHFLLVGATYMHGDFRITIAPKFRQHINVSTNADFRQYVAGAEPESVVVQMRMLHRELPSQVPVGVEMRTSANSSIMGAMICELRDRHLSSHDRKRLMNDFAADFGFALGCFISRNDLAEEQVYKRLLQSVGRRASELELRSPLSLETYQRLVASGVIDQKFATQDKPSYCVNRDCRIRFKLQRNRQYCVNCQERLISGQSIAQPTVNEAKAAGYVASKLAGAGMTTELFAKKLLGRTLHVASVRLLDSSVEIIPLAGTITPSQMELLRLRLPNALILTSRDNVGEYAGQDIECHHLHEIVLLMERDDHQAVTALLQEVNRHGLDRIRRYARAAGQRYGGAEFYRGKNREKKNLGAELFEADTHLLFSYMFRNSIWLGASRRGSAVPDGISAFPVLAAGVNGCVVWDAKYSDGKVNLGSIKKNRVYVDAARANASILANGGLKGFVFVGNQDAPATFEKRYQKLGGARTPKVTYLTARQLLSIVAHFRENEDHILGNAACQQQFTESMSALLTPTARGKKASAIIEAELKQALDGNVAAYQALRTPALTA